MSRSSRSGLTPFGGVGLMFMAGMLAYSVLRALVVGETLSQYGVNPWVFLVLDAGSSIPLAWGQVRLVQSLRQRDPKRTQRALLVVAGAFLTPYLYLLLGAGRPLPQIAYWVMAAILLGAAAATVWRIRSEARASPLLEKIREQDEPPAR